MRPFLHLRFCLLALVPGVSGALADGSRLGAEAQNLTEYARSWAAVPRQLDDFFQTPLARALRYPNEPASREQLRPLEQFIADLDAVPAGFTLPPLAQADRLRWGAFLRLAKIRLLMELSQARRDFDPAPESRTLAAGILEHTDIALALVQQALATGVSAAEREWLRTSAVEDHLHYAKAHAHAVLWSQKIDAARNKDAARAAWASVSPSFALTYPPAIPAMEKLVMHYLQDPSQIPHIVYIGVAMLTLGLLLVWFSDPRTALAAWVLRAFICVAAGMTASGIHGALELSYNGWISAGGAMAVLALFYLFNPPALPPPQRI